MTIEHHIEELRAELRNASDIAEHRQIQNDLNAAIAERDALLNQVPPY